MKTVLVILFIQLLSIAGFSQKEKAYNYITKYKDAAIEEMKRSGVPASITLAQGMLESGYGESELCKKSNNHFGIKCKNDWKGATTFHDDDEKQECFRAYSSAAESYKDHSDFLRSRPWYSSLFNLEPTDYEGWAFGLKKAGYATEKDYAQRLIRIINEYTLNEHSIVALKKYNNNTQNTVNEQIKIKNESTLNLPIAEVSDTLIEIEDTVDLNKETVINQQISLGTDSAKPQKSIYPAGVFTINHCKVVFAQEGTSLLSLANNYGISLSDLIQFNELPEMDVLDTDRLIYIEKKLKKGSKDLYIVTDKENLEYISQVEGVQLESLLIYNKLKTDSSLKKGDKVNLRAVKVK